MGKNTTLSSTSSLYLLSLQEHLSLLVPAALGGAVSCRKGLCAGQSKGSPSAPLSWGWDTAATAELLQPCLPPSACWQPCCGELSALWWEFTKYFHPALLALVGGVSLNVALSNVNFTCTPWRWPSLCDPLFSGPLFLGWFCCGHVMTQWLQWSVLCVFLFFVKF